MSTEAKRFKLHIVGVGGQGVITAADVVGRAAKDAGLEVLMGQLHGMSQRGGSVESSVLVGPHKSAFVGPGEADVVLGFEPLEAERALEKMSKKTAVILNTQPVVPFGMTRAGQVYPPLDLIIRKIEAVAGQVSVVEGSSAAHEAGSPRSLNMVMLGALAMLDSLPFAGDALLRVIEQDGRAAHRTLNRRAFELGQKLFDARRTERALRAQQP